MRRMAVSFPVRKTIPVHYPLVQRVPYRATLGDSNTLGYFSPALLGKSSGSPVRAELSIIISKHQIRMMSAGTASPPLTLMTSPGTRSLASISSSTPSRIAVTFCALSAEFCSTSFYTGPVSKKQVSVRMRPKQASPIPRNRNSRHASDVSFLITKMMKKITAIKTSIGARKNCE